MIESYTNLMVKLTKPVRRDELSYAASAEEWPTLAESVLPEDIQPRFSLDDDYVELHKLTMDNPAMNAAFWLVDRLVEVSVEAHAHIDLTQHVERYQDELMEQKWMTGQLDKTDEEILSEYLRLNAKGAYLPGFIFMALIHDVVPMVASREGVQDRQRWGEIALAATEFSKSFARNYTHLQSMFQPTFSAGGSVDGLHGGFRLDHRFFRLDADLGIDTVLPVDKVVEMMLEGLDSSIAQSYTPKDSVCEALKMKGSDGSETVFDEYWNYYNAIVQSLVYPGYVLPRTLGPEFDENYVIDTIQDSFSGDHRRLVLSSSSL